jgi:puromycin-sensitive aminopeptidase
MASTTPNPYRLSDDVLPRAYRLTLEPDLEAAVFAGHVEIDCDVTAAVDAIVLNAVDLEISSATVALADGSTLTGTTTLDAETERATIALGATIEPGPVTVVVAFTGILNDQLTGFYRSTFVDADGVTQTIATTQMEATDARRAFPCFDEPAKKATFEISLVVPEHLATYSNSEITSTETLGNGTKLVRFAPTMIMSTYLVAFVVGPFEATDALDVDGTPVRVVYPPGKAHLAPFALEVAAFSLRYFTEYFNIPYPGDKLDLLAIPDFAFGAMENLGCVTFRETALLVDPATASRLEVERVVDVVAHEIAHMWFGDLVTMGWWEGIWLNEAFATFMEVKCTDAFRPQWGRWVSFGTSRSAAMAIDGLHSTRPIEFEVISPSDARGMFDMLTYEKGGSVLRMLEEYLGEETFREGIRRYLTTHAYSNTVTNDLWAALADASGQPVGEIMDTWILQGGHPLVTVEDGVVSQQPFAYGPATGESAIGEVWEIPLLTRPLTGGPVTTELLRGESLPIAPGTIVNAGGWGVYRTRYGATELAAIAARLGDLDSLERATLIFDGWAATLAGLQPLESFLTLVEGLGTAIEPAPWTVISGALTTTSIVIDDQDRDTLAAAVRSLFTPLLDTLGWEPVAGEDEQAPTLRALAITSLGTIGADEAVRTEALARFDAGHVTGDLAGAIVAIVGAVSRPGDYDEVVRRFRSASDPQSEQRYLFGLTGFSDPACSLATFELARTEIRSQDAPYLVSSLLTNRTGGPLVFEQLEATWDECLTRFPQDAHNRMLSGISRLCHDRAFADTVAEFVTTHPVRSGQRSVLQEVERLMVNVAYGERERPTLGSVLERVATRS